MSYSLLDVLQVTIVSMLVVFVCLVSIMFLMMGFGKLFSLDKTEKATSSLSSEPEPTDVQTDLVLFENDPLAKVAVLTALAYASHKESGKAFQVVKVERK